MANKTIAALPSKANPTDSDLLVIADNADNNEMKQITIGSITADIGDGLIVDGSASLTTTYSSTKIAADNATQDAAKVSKAGDTMTGQLKLAKGADIASATTTDLGAATGNYVDVTGTTSITGLGTVAAGTTVTVRFTGILTLTYNATSLILPSGVSITTAAGDVATFTSLGSGNWRCTSYTKITGGPVIGGNITGEIRMFGGSSAPAGFLFCDASAVSRTTYAALFAVISTTYGAGDGSTTFNLPDFRGRIPVGVGTGTGGGSSGTGKPTGGSALTAVARAGWKGEETHTMTTGEMVAHTHGQRMPGTTAGSADTSMILLGVAGSVTGSQMTVNSGPTANKTQISTDSVGSTTPFNVIQPQMGVNFIIAI